MDWYQSVSFWHWSNSDLGAFHLYAAVCSLILGPMVFLRRKGDLAHRTLGMVYVLAMYITNLSALSLYSFTGTFNFFHYSAVASLLTLTVGFFSILVYGVSKSRAALDWHLQMMSWSYLGLALAAIAESVMRGIPRLYSGDVLAEFWQAIFFVSGVSGVLGFIATFVLVDRARRRWFAAYDQSNP